MRAASISSSVASRRAPSAGIADAPAGVDARAQHEAQMIGRRRHGEAGGVGERLEADVAALAHDLQALA